ncbi:MAG: N-acetyltransferase [Mariprofundaceae bacterium]|nr:N-acetyltransferase [Mariprofundaceae bacterium]
MPHRIRVRIAETRDVAAMHALLQPFADRHLILPRSRDDLFQHLQEFIVAEYDGEIAGVASVHVYGSTLAEVRSLAVSPTQQGAGLGQLLVEACEKLAAELGVKRLFALTYVPGFFEKIGYEVVPKESLPHKIWTVCVHCAKFSHCDEVAVEKALPRVSKGHAPIIEVEQAA